MKYSIIFLIISALFFLSCEKQTNNIEETTTVPNVEIFTCELSEYNSHLNSFGIITPVRKAEILPPSDNIIRKLYFHEGDAVFKGEVLAELDLKQINLQIKEAEATVLKREFSLELNRRKLAEGRRNAESRFFTINSAEIDLSRNNAELERMGDILNNKEKLFELGGITKDELISFQLSYMEKEALYKQACCSLEVQKIGYRPSDLTNEGYLPTDNTQQMKKNYIDLNTKVLQAEMKMTESELQSSRSSLESLIIHKNENVIRSPIDGIVVRRYMDEGEKAFRDKPIYYICSSDKVYASCKLSEKELLSVSLNQKAEVKAAAENLSSGTVSRVSPWIESDSGSGEVMILLDNHKKNYRFGQYVEVSIQLDTTKNEILIPRESLFEENVFLFRNNHIFKTALTTGMSRSGMISVLEGLREGDRIVRSPHQGLMDGMEVNPR